MSHMEKECFSCLQSGLVRLLARSREHRCIMPPTSSPKVDWPVIQSFLDPWCIAGKPLETAGHAAVRSKVGDRDAGFSRLDATCRRRCRTAESLTEYLCKRVWTQCRESLTHTGMLNVAQGGVDQDTPSRPLEGSQLLYHSRSLPLLCVDVGQTIHLVPLTP